MGLKKSKKERLDILLVEKGFFPSREKAKSAIMAGEVLVEGERVDKSGQRIKVESNISVTEKEAAFVSRGGEKLEKALKVFNVNVKGKRAIDVGASTGGFTDCLLKYGAEKVYCIDVGYGQLAWKLQKDSRVVVIDRTNIRYLTADKFNDLFELATIDVSFISLDKVLPAVYNLLKEKGEVVALIKPQFEAGREFIQKGGLVKKAEVHQTVIERICEKAQKIGFSIQGLTFSPLKKTSGNIEYFICLIKNSGKDKANNFPQIVEEVVKQAHQELSPKK
ncbi:MAG: TlyA family RNA methyltransferase [Atribacterota bacterium]|nr:TlyA family RNA methyltransferase [Chloroflexota bacterium]MBE3126753.1 TlyA family RNA methyltransferase [Candidatus Atribacteria bacterium]MDP2945463.1 TlyA family RNA methyltransferase [Atribacterota bacterium]